MQGPNAIISRFASMLYSLEEPVRLVLVTHKQVDGSRVGLLRPVAWKGILDIMFLPGLA